MENPCFAYKAEDVQTEEQEDLLGPYRVMTARRNVREKLEKAERTERREQRRRRERRLEQFYRTRRRMWIVQILLGGTACVLAGMLAGLLIQRFLL